MAKRDILPIFPSRANSVIMKLRVFSARRGVGLLKRKRDAIDMKLRELKRYSYEKDEQVDEAMREAIFSLAKARLLGADFKPQIVSSSKVDAVKIHRTYTKIVGVTLYCLELQFRTDDTATGFPLAGLSVGGSQVNRIRETYKKALQEMVACASFIIQVRMLEAASLQTNMRVNALEHVVIPILQNTSTYITGELEEFEREDFYRLKRSQAKQLEAKLAFSELIKTKNMTIEELTFYSVRGTKDMIIAPKDMIIAPKADVHFDADEFETPRAKERLREARHSFSTSRIAINTLQRSRDPSVGTLDLYSTKRLVLEDSRRSSTVENLMRKIRSTESSTKKQNETK